MRVAMLSFHTCPLATLGGKDTGGMNVYVRELVRALGRRGVGVDVFTRSQDEHVPHVLHHLGYGNRIVHVPAGPETPLPKDELIELVPLYTGWIQEFARQKGLEYSILHSHYWLSGLAALQLREAWGTPIIQMFHTLGEMKNRVARSESERASEARLEAEKKLMVAADRVIASTEAEMAQFRWLFQIDTDHIEIIPPGVDTTRFYPILEDEAKEYVGVDDGRRVILFVGRIEPLKGLDALLEALALLKSGGAVDRNSLCLMVIGGEPDETDEEINAEMLRLKALSTQLGVEELVSFQGRRDQDILQYYYSAAEVVVLPSHYESFGMVALEAMACGTPVVASETGGLAFLVKDGETGFHVPAADPPALAEKLQLLLEDTVQLRRMGARAAAYAQGFDWPGVADRVLNLYLALTPQLARPEPP